MLRYCLIQLVLIVPGILTTYDLSQNQNMENFWKPFHLWPPYNYYPPTQKPQLYEIFGLQGSLIGHYDEEFGFVIDDDSYGNYFHRRKPPYGPYGSRSAREDEYNRYRDYFYRRFGRTVFD